MGYHFLLQGIFPTQEYNSHLLHCRQIFYRLSHEGSPDVWLLLLFTQLCPTVCNPMDCSTPGFPILHHLPEFSLTPVYETVMPSNHLIFCRPLLLLSSIFSSIRVFSNESVLCIRWPKYWTFSFSISPSNEYSELISFRRDWFDLFAIQGILNSLLQHHSLKAP